MTVHWSVAVEGDSDLAVLRKVLGHVGHSVGDAYGRRGKSHLLKQLVNYDKAGTHSPWLIGVDLDQDFECAPSARQHWLPATNDYTLFCIVVREIEAWLLGDKESLARHFGVSVDLLPDSPELLPDPKQELVNIARRSSKTWVRKAFVPEMGHAGVTGPTYTSELTLFARDMWDVDRAAKGCPSLSRLLKRLTEFASVK